MIGRVSYSVREGEYVVDLDGDNGWTFATAAEAEHFAEVFRAAVRYHAEVEREECAALVESAAEEYARPSPGDDAHDRERNRHAADVLQWVAWDIRARGTQEAPQCPRLPIDAATPAPDATSPAGGLPVAAAGVCEACKGRGRVLYAREVEDGCDVCEATGRVAMTVAATAAKWCPRCDGSGRRLHEGWRVVRCDECRTTGRVTAEVGR